MNEEQDKQNLGLGDLADDILGERRERPYNPPAIPDASGPANGRTVNNVIAERDTLSKQQSKNAGIMSAPQFRPDIKSTYDVRPTNGMDTWFGGYIPVRVDLGTCAVISAVPGSIDFDFGLVGPGNDTDSPYQIDGCTSLAYQLQNDGGTAIDFWIYTDDDDGANTYNYYLFEDGVLIQTVTDTALPDSGSPAGVGLTVDPASDQSVYTVVVTGVTSSNVSVNTVVIGYEVVGD